jgi:hypothetical protein
MAAAMLSTMKTASTITWLVKKGGSEPAGARACREGTFMKSRATPKDHGEPSFWTKMPLHDAGRQKAVHFIVPPNSKRYFWPEVGSTPSTKD